MHFFSVLSAQEKSDVPLYRLHVKQNVSTDEQTELIQLNSTWKGSHISTAKTKHTLLLTLKIVLSGKDRGTSAEKEGCVSKQNLTAHNSEVSLSSSSIFGFRYVNNLSGEAAMYPLADG